MKLLSHPILVSTLCLAFCQAAHGQFPDENQQVRQLLDLKIQRGLFIAGDDASSSPQVPASAADCSPDRVPDATLDTLRETAFRCAHVRETYIPAVARLSSLPLPGVPSIALQKKPEAGQALSARLEADVFFNIFDAYPPPTAFEKLAELIATINKSSAVNSVTLITGTDSLESLLPWSDSLAQARGHLVHRYLLEAGLDPSIPVATRSRLQAGADSADGRARDRVVEIKIGTTKAGLPYLAAAQSYGAKISAAIKSHIVLTGPIQGNPTTQVQLRLADDGRIVETKLVASSGIQAWDEAVLRALQKVSIMPRDANGIVPSQMILHLRPY